MCGWVWAGAIITGVIMGEYVERKSSRFGNKPTGIGINIGREMKDASTSFEQSDDDLLSDFC